MWGGDIVLVIVALVVVSLPVIIRISTEISTRKERRIAINKAWEIYQVSPYLLTVAINKKRVKVNERLDSIDEIKKKVTTSWYLIAKSL